MANTLLLDAQTWDLTLDASGNLAIADESYSLAQDAASAIRLFQGELWFDTTQGVPYFARILSQRPPISLLKEYFVRAAMTVPGVVRAACFISSISERGVNGQVQITDGAGTTAAVAF